MAIPYPTKMNGAKLNIHTRVKRRISGPGIFCCAAMALRLLAQNKQNKANEVRSASLSPLSSINSMMEYFAFRMLVWMARSAFEMDSSDAPLGIEIDSYKYKGDDEVEDEDANVLDNIRRADVPLLHLLSCERDSLFITLGGGLFFLVVRGNGGVGVGVGVGVERPRDVGIKAINDATTRACLMILFSQLYYRSIEINRGCVGSLTPLAS